MLTDQDKQFLRTAFDAAIKASPDSMAAASVLIPLMGKIEAIANEISELKQNSQRVVEAHADLEAKTVKASVRSSKDL